MAKKRKDDGPALFGGDPDPQPANGAYGRPPALMGDPARREQFRAAVAAVAREVIVPETRQLQRYRTAIDRAIGLLDADDSYGGMEPSPARIALAVLRECLLPEPPDGSWEPLDESRRGTAELLGGLPHAGVGPDACPPGE